MWKPIETPDLTGTFREQLAQVKRWPRMSYLTVIAVFPMKHQIEASQQSIHNGTILDELLRYRHSMRLVTAERIYELVSSFVRNLQLAMNIQIDGRQSKWYSLNCYMLRAQAMAILPAVLGKDTYDRHKLLIHELLQLPPVFRHFVGVCSRQVGKTQTVIALLVAAMLSMTEDAEIDIYANSAVARMTNARKFVSAMAQILENHPEVRMFFQHVRGTVANDSVIEYKNTRYNCRLLLRMRTGPGEEMRGVIARISFVDEFAFLQDDVMRHIKVIRTTREDAHLLMLTTHGGDTGSGKFASDVINDPKKYFNNGTVFESSFICNACKLLPDQTKCEHMIGHFPPWRDVRAAMADIKNAEGNPIQLDLARRELLGIASSGRNFVISSNTLAAVFQSARYVIPPTFKPSPPVLWIAMDPSSGMDTSSFAVIFAVAGSEGQRFILGGESFLTVNIHSDEIHQVIIDCMSTIFEKYEHMLQGCSVSWMYEANNNATVVANFAHTMRAYCSARAIPIDTYSIYGELAGMARGISDKTTMATEGAFWSRAENKQSGLNEWLKAANTGRIRWADPFITTGTISFSQTADLTSKQRRGAEGVFRAYAFQRETCASNEFAVDRFISVCEEQMRQLRTMPNGSISGKGVNKPLKHDDVAIAMIILFEAIAKLSVARSYA